VFKRKRKYCCIHQNYFLFAIMPIIGWFTRNSILCLHSKLRPFVMKLPMLHIIYEFQLSFAYLLPVQRNLCIYCSKGDMVACNSLCIYVFLFLCSLNFNYLAMCFLNPFSNFTTDFSQKLFHLRALENFAAGYVFFFPYWYRKNCLIGKIGHLFQICLLFWCL
jgi:hypothetical protein